jgi:hypothetical protein
MAGLPRAPSVFAVASAFTATAEVDATVKVVEAGPFCRTCAEVNAASY